MQMLYGCCTLYFHKSKILKVSFLAKMKIILYFCINSINKILYDKESKTAFIFEK